MPRYGWTRQTSRATSGPPSSARSRGASWNPRMPPRSLNEQVLVLGVPSRRTLSLGGEPPQPSVDLEPSTHALQDRADVPEGIERPSGGATDLGARVRDAGHGVRN